MVRFEWLGSKHVISSLRIELLLSELQLYSFIQALADYLVNLTAEWSSLILGIMKLGKTCYVDSFTRGIRIGGIIYTE